MNSAACPGRASGNPRSCRPATISAPSTREASSSRRDRSGSPTPASSRVRSPNVNHVDDARGGTLGPMAIQTRPARPEEFREAGRVTADAYREYADSDSWDRYLETIADVEG